MSRPPLLPGQPPELVVLDEPEDCSYLPGRTARRPLRLPVRALAPEELDQRLAAGDRRTGPFLYTQRCPACHACIPLRVDAPAFTPNRTQRRVARATRADLTVEVGPRELDEERLALFDRHERERGLRKGEGDADADGYARAFLESCADGFEVRYRRGARLAAVALVDRGATALSAVYTYWDPSLAALSPGVFSILTQLELCRRLGLRWLYLGLWIAENRSMRYKVAYLPHERLEGGAWRRYERE